MTGSVKGTAGYFPSIEKKYGRPIEEWKELIRSLPLTRHMELVARLKTQGFGVVGQCPVHGDPPARRRPGKATGTGFQDHGVLDAP